MGNELVSHPVMRLKGALQGIGTKSVFASVVAAVTAAAIPSTSAAAGIELGEGLTVAGFVDMSYVYSDVDASPASKVFGVDQVETQFMYSGSHGVSAQVDIEFSPGYAAPGAEETIVEQAYITKAFSDQFSMKAGRFLSYSGWETEEPTGLFQYSGTGYAPSFYGFYQQGVSASYSGEKFAVMGSLVNDVFGYAGGPLQDNTEDLGYELGVALMPVEGLTAKLFYMKDEKTDREVINFWASYAVNGFTFAGEYNDADYGVEGKGDGFLLMANYASGNAGITVRYHDFSDDSAENVLGLQGVNRSAITISPSYKVGDKLLLVGEYRMDDLEGGIDGNSIALEALFMF